MKGQAMCYLGAPSLVRQIVAVVADNRQRMVA